MGNMKNCLNKSNDKVIMKDKNYGSNKKTKKVQLSLKDKSVKELKESIDNLELGKANIEDITRLLPIIKESTYCKLSDSEKNVLFNFDIDGDKNSILKKGSKKIFKAVNVVNILTFIKNLKFNLDMVKDLDINKVIMSNGIKKYVVNQNYGKVDKYLFAVREYLANFDPLLVSSFSGEFIKRDRAIDYESYFNSPKVAYRFKDYYEKEKCIGFCEELKFEYENLGVKGDCSSLVNQALDSTIIFAKSYENCDIVIKCKSKYAELTQQALILNHSKLSKSNNCDRQIKNNKVNSCESNASLNDSKINSSSKKQLSDDEEETLSLFGGIMEHCKNCCDK
jgi:hypothetical protein